MRKYVAEWKGKKIFLTEEDYERLSMRFDIRNFDLGQTLYINRVVCPLCKKYLTNNLCIGCTFNKFNDRVNSGCFRILDQISKEIKVIQCLYLCDDYIAFRLSHKNEATELINYVKELLLTEFQLVVRKK